MKGIASSRENKEKRRKSRPAQIEGFYEHPVEKEVRPKLDLEVIAELETSIQELLKKLLRFERNRPKVININVQALKLFELIEKDLTQLNNRLKLINKKISDVKSDDPQLKILLLREKQNMLSDVLSDVEPKMEKLEQLEKEIYPDQINRERFFKDYHDTIEIVSQLYKQYKQVDDKALKSGIGFQIHGLLKKIREEVVATVVKEHRRVCEEYKENPATITSSQYAAIINGRCNLTPLVDKFQELYNSFDAKVAFETKTEEVARKASIINSAYDQLKKLLITHPNDLLTQQLKAVLCRSDGTLKVRFNEQDFSVSTNSSVANELELDNKVLEIETIYQALLNLTKDYQSHFNIEATIQDIIQRTAVVSAIGYKSPLNINKIQQEIQEYGLETEFNILKFMSINLINSELILEGQRISSYIDGWHVEFPNLLISDENSFIFNKQTYPIIPPVMDYNTTRNKLVKALQSHDEPEEDYKSLYAKLVTTKTALFQYINEEDQLEPQRLRLRILLEKIKCTIHSIPVRGVDTILFDTIEETDRQFLYQFLKLRTDVEMIKTSINMNNFQLNNQLIDEWSAQFKLYHRLYKDIKNEFSAINSLMSIFKNILNAIENKYNQLIIKNDPRSKVVAELRDIFQLHNNTIKSLRRFLGEEINHINDETKDKFRVISEELLKEKVKTTEQIKTLMNSAEMIKLPKAQFNPLIAWMVLLIRPYISFDSEVKPKQRFFGKKINIEMDFSPSQNRSPNTSRAQSN